MKTRNLFIFLIFTLLALVSIADAQRTSRIYRPCWTIPPVQAKAEIVNSNRIDIRTCHVANGEINIDAGTVRIGDMDDEGGSTRIIVDDTTNSIQLYAASGTTVGNLTAGEVNLGGFLTFSNPGGNAIFLARTVTPAGTTGNRTINAMAGSVNFAAGTSSITVTNSMAAANSLIFCTIQSNDATATACRVSDRGAGSFTIRLNANATAETAVGFWVTN
jgi:hypothetical protein